MVCVALLYSHMVKKQGEQIHERYLQGLKTQTESLAEYCTEAVAGGDLAVLESIMTKLRDQSDVRNAAIFELPSKTVLASTTKGTYGQAHQIEAASDSLKMEAPIVVAGNPWAILHINFTDTGGAAELDSYKKTLLVTAGIVFLAGSALVFILGIVIAKQYANTSEPQFTPTPSDALGLPDLTHETIINMPATPPNPEPTLSPEEKTIVQLIGSQKKVAEILKASDLEEFITFEHLTNLVAKGVVAAG